MVGTAQGHLCRPCLRPLPPWSLTGPTGRQLHPEHTWPPLACARQGEECWTEGRGGWGLGSEGRGRQLPQWPVTRATSVQGTPGLTAFRQRPSGTAKSQPPGQRGHASLPPGTARGRICKASGARRHAQSITWDPLSPRGTGTVPTGWLRAGSSESARARTTRRRGRGAGVWTPGPLGSPPRKAQAQVWRAAHRAASPPRAQGCRGRQDAHLPLCTPVPVLGPASPGPWAHRAPAQPPRPRRAAFTPPAVRRQRTPSGQGPRAAAGARPQGQARPVTRLT